MFLKLVISGLYQLVVEHIVTYLILIKLKQIETKGSFFDKVCDTDNMLSLIPLISIKIRKVSVITDNYLMEYNLVIHNQTGLFS